ncbi:hypothetical protein HMPREF1544_06299 [Mucor circinelloides 1006PhL]|uniref:Uncharacterized protein n=1 Tax=Mucor circinelloides f. circinelloides (strain 1006PhL) TaxID=1220926 RepID=S2JVS6_MUCC1|nr:hypothetical protein HMPREF1544_06299 [Mucor circinelloides 1006PhL]
MLSPDIHVLSGDQTDQLLLRLTDWRSGICPDGKLAQQPCFVLNQKPSVYIHPDQPLPAHQMLTTELITEWEWADNLVDCGAITHLNDDAMMKIMSDYFKIFHAANDMLNNQNTLHSLQLRKHASIKIDNIERPTRALSLKLQQVLSEPDTAIQWIQLVDLWDTFGYFWPRKLVLGYKRHHKQTYKFANPADSMHAFYKHLGLIKDKHSSTPKMPSFNVDQFLIDGTVISRLELTPLHEFLDTESQQAINQIIHAKFVQIPVYHPIKIYNVSTHSYLCWGPGAANQPDPIFPGEKLDYLVRAISADSTELIKSPETQYLWRLTWSPTATHGSSTMDPMEHRSQTIKGSDQVYIYPACKSRSPAKSKSNSTHDDKTQAWQINDRMSQEPDFVETHKMVLTCRPYRHDSRLSDRDFSKLRGLRLLASDSTQYSNEKIDWTIQYPGNGLKYMTDVHANIKLNFHEHVRRIKPVLEGDTIQLQQIGLLTAFDQMAKSTNMHQGNESPPQDVHPQSLRTTKKIVVRKPSTKSRNKKNVLCVDEDITNNRFQENTHWKIQLANSFDKKRHSSNFYRWPAKNNDQQYGYPKDYHPMLSQDVRNHLASHLNRETGSLVSTATAASSLRRTKSLGSLHDKPSVIHTGPNSDKAPYFEDLLTTKQTSNLLSQFVKKVSLQPLAQLVKPLRPKPSQSNNHLSPPPFTSHHSFD